MRVEHDGPVTIVTIDRPEARNAVDGPTSVLLADAFRAFDKDDDRAVAVLTGVDGTFCAGADLKAISDGRGNPVREQGDGPMGPSRMLLDKPVIAAVEGYAVAGGLELALWCDLRVAATDAVFGVFCRRWGVPLIDGGTIRLPRLIGQSHALDLILTGRGVSGDEALRMGLANRLVEPGGALAAAVTLANELAALPQRACARIACRRTSSGTSRCRRRCAPSTATGWRRSRPATRSKARCASPRARAGTDNRPTDRVRDPRRRVVDLLTARFVFAEVPAHAGRDTGRHEARTHRRRHHEPPGRHRAAGRDARRSRDRACASARSARSSSSTPTSGRSASSPNAT